MTRLTSSIATALVISASLFARAVVAGDPPVNPIDREIALDDNDRRMITLQVLKFSPLVASSPGIKFAEAHRSSMRKPEDWRAGIIQPEE